MQRYWSWRRLLTIGWVVADFSNVLGQWQYENDAEVLIADISFDEDDTLAAKGVLLLLLLLLLSPSSIANSSVLTGINRAQAANLGLLQPKAGPSLSHAQVCCGEQAHRLQEGT
jgi:hypothetical protein